MVTDKSLAQSCYLMVERPGAELATFWLWVRLPDHYITTPQELFMNRTVYNCDTEYSTEQFW